MFTQRICGVCTTVHAIASVRAVENALNLDIPLNAQYIRNLILAAHAMHDHIVHFYHLSALDWVDIVSALQAGDSTAVDSLREPVVAELAAPELGERERRIRSLRDENEQLEREIEEARARLVAQSGGNRTLPLFVLGRAWFRSAFEHQRGQDFEVGIESLSMQGSG